MGNHQIMRQKCDMKFRFIPFRKHDIVEMCLQDKGLAEQEADFRYLCRVLAATFHYEFHQIIETLKNAYAPFDPDSDTRTLEHAEDVNEEKFVALFCGLLEQANYERITNDEIQQALKESSLFNIQINVDFNTFEEHLLFFRGQSLKKETTSRWLGMLKGETSFSCYDRVVVFIRFKENGDPAGTKASSSRPRATILKLFQDVPKADIEILFPNTRISMRTIDKLLIGVPAMISGGAVLATKMSTTLLLLFSLFAFYVGLRKEQVPLQETELIALFAGFTALGGYFWKQFNNYKNRKLKYMQTLIQSLYFKNLDNNAGVLYRIANDAEEEEFKEALLAYYFLLTCNRPQSKAEIDQRIEAWLAERWHCPVDFEIDDALQKLLRLELVRNSDGLFSAIPVKAAIETLDRNWDAFFAVPE